MTIITIERKLLEEVVEIFDNAISARYPHEILRDIRAAIAAPATAPELSQHDDLDKVATARYKVVKSRSTIWPCSVVAGDGEQELFSGSESTCKHVARKLTGAFLDGAFYSQSTATLQSATAPECKTSGGDARAVALARLLDQAYERGVAVGLSQAVPATAPEPIDPADLCDVCKEPVRYGSRHHACGEAMLRAKANAAPATAPEKTVQEIMEFARHYAANTFSSATLEDKIRRSLAAPATALVVTKNESGQIVAVTRQDEDERIVEVLAESAPATAPKQCWCQTCRPITQHDNRMVLCPDCGNKRCPKATDHRNACTGSNEPGQPGSSYPTVPATAPDWHDVQPPFGSIRNAAMAIYRPPFRFVNGYVYDNQNHVVADHDNISEKLVTGSVCARVRGWGRIGYMPNAAKLQDEVGALIADALNEYYAAHPQIPEDKP
jgi:hypothetical protein